MRSTATKIPSPRARGNRSGSGAVGRGERAARFSLGVDIGGTFTDFALMDSVSGAVHAAKVLTNYKDLTEGVLEGVRQLRSLVVPAPGDGAAPSSRTAAPAARSGTQIERVIHGTTLATNALITRR